MLATTTSSSSAKLYKSSGQLAWTNKHTHPPKHRHRSNILYGKTLSCMCVAHAFRIEALNKVALLDLACFCLKIRNPIHLDMVDVLKVAGLAEALRLHHMR